MSQPKSDKTKIAHNFNPDQPNQATEAYLGDSLNDKPKVKKRGSARKNSDNASQKSKMSSVSKASKRSQVQKMVSFRELREIQRQQETSHMGPGTHDTLKPFGSDLQKINFGSKIKFNPNANPGPGQYEPGKAVKIVHPTSYEAFIKVGRKLSLAEPNPDAGMYEPHKSQWESPQKMTWQGKYKFKPDSNPPPGYYDTEKADNQVRHQSASYRQSGSKRYNQILNDNPDAGAYEPHKNNNFGDIPQKMTWQGKYKFQPDSNPPPGLYDPNQNVTKSSSSRYAFPKEGRTKGPKDVGPSPGEYDGHLKPFGTIPQNMTWQGKYKFVPDSNPPPGLYDPTDKHTKSTSPSYSQKKERKRDKLDESRNQPGPGEYDGHIIPFGQDKKNKMSWQGKYQFKPDSNPPPGMYDADVALTKSSLPRAKSAHIRKRMIEERPKEAGPSPGDYDGHLKPFGDIPQNMTWQGKYKFVPDSNPPPGLYDPNKADGLTKNKSSSFSPSKEKRDKQVANDVPEAGLYNPDKGFGNIEQKMTIGGKYKWKPQDGPGPGYYDSDRAIDAIKTSSPSARMDKQLVSVRSNDPSPAVYDGHHKIFGADINGFTIGLKDKWKAKEGPGPGEYNHERADSQTRQRSPAARIDQDTMVALDTIQVYQSSSKLNVSTRKRQSAPIPEEQSEETPSPAKVVPKAIDDSTKSGSPLKQLNS